MKSSGAETDYKTMDIIIIIAGWCVMQTCKGHPKSVTVPPGESGSDAAERQQWLGPIQAGQGRFAEYI